jgi:hypothetical protein
MPSGSLHSPRRSRRPALRLLATLLLALALAEPAFAESFGAEELREAEAVLAAGGVEAPPEVTVPDVAVPDVAVPEVAVDVPDTVEAVEVPDPAVPESVEPPPEPAPAPAAEAPPAAPAERRGLLGAGDPVADLAAAPPEQIAKGEDAAREALALMREEAGAQLQDLGAAVESMKGDVASMKGDVASMKGAAASMKGEVAQLKEGFDWTLNRSSGCGGASAAGLGSNWTLDGACLPQNLRGDWLGGDRPIEDRLGGLLEALLPEGMGLGEAAGGLELPGSDPLRHRSEGRRPQAAATDLGVGSALEPPGDGPAELSRASARAARSPLSADSTAGRASGPGPVRDPVSEPPEPLAAAAGLAPGTGGGGGGGAFFVLLIAALVGGLALLPPPPGERVHALGRRLTSLLSSSRLERPG